MDMSNICTSTESIDRADVSPTALNEVVKLYNSLVCRFNQLHTNFAIV